MPNTNILDLNYSDNQDQLIDKINNNFDEIVELHGGSLGLTGPTGERGAIGIRGAIGQTGFAGTRGTRWFVESVQPYGTGDYVIEGDYWVNSSNGDVWIFTESGWSPSGYNLNPSGSIFSQIVSTHDGVIFPAISSGLTGSSIVEGQNIPSKYTFVISDEVPESGISNELLSKFVISTDPSSNSGYVLEFSKSNIETGQISDYSLHPYFRWDNSGSGDESLSIGAPGGSFGIGTSGGFDSEFNSMNISSASNFDLYFGTATGSGMFVT